MNKAIIGEKVHHNTKHGMDGTPEYRAWVSMRMRCTKKNHPAYHNYGGRGIQVCKEWNKFETFYADMGNRPRGKSLDRINNEGNYEAGNCRWATRHEQASNKRKNAPRDKTHLLHNCQICKKDFHVNSPSLLKKTKYCSRKCWSKTRALPRVEKVALNCEQCNKECFVTPYYSKQKYCSSKCYQARRAQKE